MDHGETTAYNLFVQINLYVTDHLRDQVINLMIVLDRFNISARFV
jgi:hypothetical protein